MIPKFVKRPGLDGKLVGVVWPGEGRKALGKLEHTINLCLLGHGSALETAAQTLSCVFSGAEIMKRPQKEGHISASSLNTPPSRLLPFTESRSWLHTAVLFSSQSPALAHLFAFC